MKKFLTSLFTPELRTPKIDSDPPGTADITIGSSFNANGNTFYGFPEPVNDDWVATKNYVDGKNTKQACRMATTASITLSGAPTVDGLTPQPGDRVLVKNQSPTGFNGIYVAAAGPWTRATDNDSEPEMNNAFVWIAAGTANADTAWLQTIEQSSLGTDSQLWVKKAGTGSITSNEIGFYAVFPNHIHASASSTPDSTTFLRGDDTWAVPPGGGGSGVPIGSMMMWPATTAPTDWLLCDGTSYANTAYPTLATLLRATATFVVDANNFRTPDLVRRVAVGAGPTLAVGRNDGVATSASRTFAHSHAIGSHTHGLGTANEQGVPTGTGGGQRLTGGNTSGPTANPTANSVFDDIPNMCLAFIIRAA